MLGALQAWTSSDDLPTNLKFKLKFRDMDNGMIEIYVSFSKTTADFCQVDRFSKKNSSL